MATTASGPGPRWCVYGATAGQRLGLIRCGMASREDALGWLRAHHKGHPELVAWHVDQEDDGYHEHSCFFDRHPDGSLREVMIPGDRDAYIFD